MGWLEMAAKIQTAGQTVFGESVTFTPSSTSTPETVTGIFDAEAVVQEPVGDVMIETTKPMVTLKIASLSGSPVRGDTIAIRSINYKVLELQPDGHGDLVVAF